MPATISRTKADYDFSRVPEEPVIGIAMPFQPTTQSKNEISHAINCVLAGVKSRLDTTYSEDTVLRTLLKLEGLVKSLHYASDKKSVVISIISGTERVIYLNHHVATKLLINEQFYLGDLIEKMQTAPPLHFLLITNCWAKLYHFENHVLQRVGFHRTEHYQPCHFPQTHLSESRNCAVIANENTLFRTVNRILSHFYQKTFYPLIIAGKAVTVEEFTSATIHKHHIVAAVSTEKSCVGDEAILELLRPATSKSSQFRKKYFLNIMRDAYRRNNLLFGQEKVELASNRGENSLMVIDKEQMDIKRYGSYAGNTTDSLTRLDTMIEKLLNRNGHVEIIESGMPTAYGGVVLLQREEHLRPIRLGQRSSGKHNLL
jgi:hypothetical protein